MAGSGRKTFSPGDVLTSSDVQNYLMDQSVMVFAGTAARTSAIPSPSAGMVAYSTATGLQLYNGTAWVAASTGYGVATGGTSLTPWAVSTVNYNGMKFTTDGNLVVSTSGLFDVCLIGGGGTGNRGGGGAGGLLIQTIYLVAATYTVDVGAGGSTAGTFTDGYESTIGGVIGSANIAACGGGSNGSSHNTGYGNQAAAASTVTAQNQSQGKDGGAGTGSNGGGGGGGAGSVGSNGSGNNGGNGGTGFDITAFNSNTSLFVCGGGAGGGTGTGGTGGSSSGGNGGVNGSPAAQNGVANTGGGGGGVGQGSGTAGNGGSGAVYIRFRV
jgi:hypothetical protein